MFESIFGLHSVLIASTRTSYGHDRVVLSIIKMGSNFYAHFYAHFNLLDSYVAILQRALRSGLFFLLTSNSELKRILSMMVSPPMPPTPHTKWIHLWCDDYLEVNIIGYVSVVGITRNHRLWREIILTIRGIKSPYFTQSTYTLASQDRLTAIYTRHLLNIYP